MQTAINTGERNPKQYTIIAGHKYGKKHVFAC